MYNLLIGATAELSLDARGMRGLAIPLFRVLPDTTNGSPVAYMNSDGTQICCFSVLESKTMAIREEMVEFACSSDEKRAFSSVRMKSSSAISHRHDPGGPCERAGVVIEKVLPWHGCTLVCMVLSCT